MSAPPPGAARPRTRAALLLAVVALTAAVLGVVGLARADDGLTTRRVTVSGVPVTEVRAGPPEAGGGRPGVVVAHGFAGSARLMRPLADTVARAGAVALLLDFAGHGANPSGLPGAGRNSRTGADRLAADLDAAVAHLRTRPDVDPDRIVLVGHSMGAGAVTRYAAVHPEIARTVAISLPDADDLPAGRPAGLLLVVGGAEFPGFRRAAEEALRRGAPEDRLVVVPATEHISVLFAARTHRAVVDWLPGVDGDRPAPEPTGRLVAAGLLLLGFGLGFVPLAGTLLGRRAGSTRAPVRAPPVLAVALAAAGLAAGVAGPLPTARLPLAVGGHVAGFLLASGVLLAVAATRWPGPARLASRSVPPPSGPVDRRRSPRPVAAAVVLTGYAATAVAVPVHLGVTSALPVGARWWLLPVVGLAALVFLSGAERLTAGHGWLYAAVGGIVVAVLTVAAVLGLAPGFVLLVVPLFAVLVGWQAAWAAVLRRLAGPRWLPALVGAVLLAWPVATTLPLS